MNTLVLREYKSYLRMTERQRELVEGVLLGDAHLERQRGSLYARLKVEHSARQSAYVDWQYNELREWVLTPPRERVRRNRLGTSSVNIGFSTLSHQELETIRRRFYVDGRKIVPEDLHLTRLSTAVWFMDDGSKKSSQCRGVYFNTQGYAEEEIEILRVALKRDVGVDTSVRRQRDGMQIYVPSSSVEKLISFVSPYVLQSMRYKLSG